MSCIKTGASIYLRHYGRSFRGDAFLIEGCYIFRLTSASGQYVAPGTDFDFTLTDHSLWFNQDNTYSTLIASEHQVHV